MAPPKPTASSDASATAGDVATLGYEQARDELVAIVGRLEAGAAELEESMSLWRRAEALSARCLALLDGAEQEIREATSAPSDDPEADPR